MSRWLVNGYHFCAIAAPAELVAELQARAVAFGLTGTVLIAPEGINVSLFGGKPQLASVLSRIEAAIGDALTDVLWTPMSPAGAPFRRLRVRARSEIVTFGQDLPVGLTGATDVPPAQWNALLANTDVRVVDVRNDYEIEQGTFAGAQNPQTASFTAFRAFVERELMQDLAQPVAMFCTGGIRCAKAGAWMRSVGFTNLYQLQGGILGYLSHPDVDKQKWQGQCFVFDDRETLPADRPNETGSGRRA